MNILYRKTMQDHGDRGTGTQNGLFRKTQSSKPRRVSSGFGSFTENAYQAIQLGKGVCCSSVFNEKEYDCEHYLGGTVGVPQDNQNDGFLKTHILMDISYRREGPSGPSTNSFFGLTKDKDPYKSLGSKNRRSSNPPNKEDDTKNREIRKSVSFRGDTKTCNNDETFQRSVSDGSSRKIPKTSLTSRQAHEPFFKPKGKENKAQEEETTVENLKKDCFVIPATKVQRFLPDGVKLPKEPGSCVFSNLHMMEIDDPHVKITFHIMTPLQPNTPTIPPVTSIKLQRNLAKQLLDKVRDSKWAVEGVLLVNMERHTPYPFINFYLLTKKLAESQNLPELLTSHSSTLFDPSVTQHSAGHQIDTYEEVVTIACPPIGILTKKPSTPNTGYIISMFRVFVGDDREKFERNWLYWTGAKSLYRSLPKSYGLKRITLHKSVTTDTECVIYLLVCECSNLLNQFLDGAPLIPVLRSRLCGYTGFYKPLDHF